MLLWCEFLRDHFLLNYVWLSVRLYVILKSYNLVLILILGTLHFYCGFFFFFKFSVSQGFSVSVDFSEWDYVTMTSPRKQWKWSSNLVSVKSQGAVPSTAPLSVTVRGFQNIPCAHTAHKVHQPWGLRAVPLLDAWHLVGAECGPDSVEWTHVNYLPLLECTWAIKLM